MQPLSCWQRIKLENGVLAALTHERNSTSFIGAASMHSLKVLQHLLVTVVHVLELLQPWVLTFYDSWKQEKWRKRAEEVRA